MKRLERPELRVLLAITALAAGLRFSTLGVQSYWSDEAVTAALLHQSFGGMLHDIPASESTPPLYYVLAWLWTRVFGLGEAGLRSLSAVFGALLVPVAYVLAARLASVRAGLVTAALVAVNPLLWWYSQEARSYALVVLLTALATAEFVAVERRGKGAWPWAAWSALALATHYFAVFIVAPQFLWLAFRARPKLTAKYAANLGLDADRDPRPRLSPSPFAAVVIAGIALAPLAISQASNRGAKFISTAGSLAFRTVQVPKQFLVGFNAPLEKPSTVVAALLALVALFFALTRTSNGERRGATLAAAVALIALVVPFMAALAGADYLIARNLIPALVPALAVLGIGFGTRRVGPFGIAGAAALSAIGVATIVAVMTTSGYQRDDWRTAARALGPADRDRVIVLTPSEGRAAMQWYLKGTVQIGVKTVGVAEIDVVGLGRRIAGQKPRPPRGPFGVPHGFALYRMLEAATYTIRRYRAPSPIPIEYLVAASNRLSPDLPAEVLYQARRRTR